jgi:UPF0271 protein
MKSIDLNADMGESFGAWTIGRDAELLAQVSSANVACAWHAGDPAVMIRTVAAAAAAGVAIGAHPGYPDLGGFGRRSMALSEDETYGCVLYQIGALRIIAEAAGCRLSHVKPHGALYNDAAMDPLRARGVARAVRDAGGGLYLVGLPDCALGRAALELGLPYAAEFFADRAYDDQGRLVPRSAPGAVIHDRDLAVCRTLDAITTGLVQTITGTAIPAVFDTICLHGDNPEAVIFARALRAALQSSGIAVQPPVFQSGRLDSTQAQPAALQSSGIAVLAPGAQSSGIAVQPPVFQSARLDSTQSQPGAQSSGIAVQPPVFQSGRLDSTQAQPAALQSSGIAVLAPGAQSSGIAVQT